VEKVCVAWWRQPEDDIPDLLSSLLPVLSAPPVRAATLHVESADHAALRYGAGADGRLLAGLASVWLDSYQDLPDALVGDAGWLVCESVPQPYGEALTWDECDRSPGLTLVTLLDKPADLDEPEFYRYWHELHRVTTAECHPFASYVRNEVARPLSPGAPSVRGIVTESAPDVQDFLDPHRFYVSGGDAEQLRVNQKRVFGEVMHFIDMATIQVAPMVEYVVRRLAATSP
jgi:hypothetical protein